jgi:hypothetical protein
MRNMADHLQVLDISKSSWEVVSDGQWAGKSGTTMQSGRRQQFCAVHNSTIYCLKVGRSVVSPHHPFTRAPLFLSMAHECAGEG